MKKIKNVFIIAILAVLSFSMVSCENENIGTPASVSEANVNNDLNASHDDGLVHTRGSGYEWYGNYKIYNVDPSDQERRGTTFDFKIHAYPPLAFDDISIEFKAPLGGTYYKKMSKNISSSYCTYTKSIILQQYGTYKYRYVHTSDYSAINNYKEVHVLLPPEDSGSLSYDSNVSPIFYSDGTVGEKYDFIYKECVSWVALKVNQLWDTNTAFRNKMFGTSAYNRLGDAEHWKDVLVRNGYTYSQTPKPNCIAWWDADDNGALSGGHIAFVHRVYSDGAVYLSEYNWYGHHHQHGERYVGPNDDYYPTGFIYVPKNN